MQSTPAGNTGKAAYQAGNDGGKEALWLCKVMCDLCKHVTGPVVLHCDSTSAKSLMMNNGMTTHRAKHDDVIHHWCLDWAGRKEIAFKNCSTHLNRADGPPRPSRVQPSSHLRTCVLWLHSTHLECSNVIPFTSGVAVLVLKLLSLTLGWYFTLRVLPW